MRARPMHTFDDRFPHSDQSAQHAAHQRAYLDPNVSEPPRIMQNGQAVRKPSHRTCTAAHDTSIIIARLSSVARALQRQAARAPRVPLPSSLHTQPPRTAYPRLRTHLAIHWPATHNSQKRMQCSTCWMLFGFVVEFCKWLTILRPN